MDDKTQETKTNDDVSVKTDKITTETKEEEVLEMSKHKEQDDDEISNNLNDTSNEDMEDTHSVRSESVSSEHLRSGSDEDVHHEEDEDVQHEEDEEDEGSVILEREEGDGQESTPNRKVDDDEDKRNPQYIPKRGTFYEHDDRTAVEEGVEAEKAEEKTSEKDANKKKVWLEKESSRWQHDKFNDQEQAPKSRSELVSIYGYDIRNEEGPPRARRRRRYGRGPNKYTRNWEDEDAYNKAPPPSVRGGRKTKVNKTGEEFPPLNGNRNQSRNMNKDKSDALAGGDNQESNKQANNNNFQDNGNRSSKQDLKGESLPPPAILKIEPSRNENGNYKSPKPHHSPSKKEQKPDGRTVSRTIKPSPRTEDPKNAGHTRGVTRTRGFRGAGRGGSNSNRSTQQSKSQQSSQQEENSDYIVSQNFTNKNINQQALNEVEKDISNLNIQESGNYGRSGKFNNQRQNSVPPRLQAEQRGSKRYSSIRQRSLPETAATPSFSQQQHVIHYTQEFPQQNQQQSQQPILSHPPPIVSQVPTNTSQPMMTVQPTNQQMGSPMPHQIPPASSGPILQPPQISAQFANPFPPAPTFIQPGVAPPAFIPQQAPPPQMINYGQPPQFPPQEYANFQHQQFAPVNQPQAADMYQAQSGITYFSMQNQQVVPRVQAKRPKAAIPIVPPPEHKEPRGRGRLSQGDDSPVGGTPDLSHQENYEIEKSGLQYGSNDVIVQQ